MYLGIFILCCALFSKAFTLQQHESDDPISISMNEDKCKGFQCKNGGICEIRNENPVCKCPDLFTGDKCQIEIDGCILKMIYNECNKPNEICENGKCRCRENYKYSNDNKSCEEDKCAMCPKNTDCKPHLKNPCQCKNGYFDGIKCIQTSKCQIGSLECEQKCNPKTGECFCDENFNLNADMVSCDMKEEISSCDLDCNIGSCIEKNGKQYCICPELTHKFVNNTCINLCTISKGKPPKGLECPGECESDGDYGFHCKCGDGYEQAEDGIHCRRKEMSKDKNFIEKCRSQIDLCQELYYENGHNSCFWDKDYAMTYINGRAVCKNKCYEKSGDCFLKTGKCELNEDYNAECVCPVSLTRKDNSSSCNEIVKFSYLGVISFLKSKYLVENKFSDLQKGSKYIVSYPSLKKDLKESVQYVYGNNLKDIKIIKPLRCKEEGNLLTCVIELQLKKQPKTVNALLSSSYCYALPEGFCFVKNLVMKRGKSSDVFKQTDPCVLKNVFCGKTTNCESSITERNIKCTCKEGFLKIRSYNPVINKGNLVELCRDIDECSTNTHSCPENTTCLNTFGSYVCPCKDGFVSKDGEFDGKKHGCEEIDKCSTNSCPEHTTCLNTFESYECLCKAGFISKAGGFDAKIHGCEAIFKSSVITYKYILITGGVVGASFIISLIIGVVFYKIKKSRRDRLNEQRQNVASVRVVHVQRNENYNSEMNPAFTH